MNNKIKVLLFIVFLIGINFALYQIMLRYRFRSVIVHHSASRKDNYASIKYYHQKEHAWRDAAYHLILSNGSTKVPLGYLEASKRYRYLSYALATKSRYHNLRAVHLCVIGNYEERPVPKELIPALSQAILLLQRRYHIPDEQILFHRDVDATLCPGKYISKENLIKWIHKCSNNCPEKIITQQKQVLEKASFSLHTLPPWFLLLSGGSTLFFCLSWLLLSWVCRLFAQDRDRVEIREV